MERSRYPGGGRLLKLSELFSRGVEAAASYSSRCDRHLRRSEKCERISLSTLLGGGGLLMGILQGLEVG